MKPQQVAILKKIKGELRHGDLQVLAERTEYTREYVGMCLNPRNDCYNSIIVEAAMKLAEEHAEELKNQLEKLNNL